jgi:nitrite reductase/ring-hydroxylating ferredoxin subunit/uncharacterized membrane protein
MAIATTRFIEAVEGQIAGQRDWLDPTADSLQALLGKTLRGGPIRQRLKDFLNGVWFGHPLHPALILLPAGSWVTAAILDAAGSKKGADRAILAGILSSVPTAMSGLAEWQDTSDEPRRVGLVHALLNSAALTCYVASYAARRGGQRGVGQVLSTLGLALVTCGAYLGGELAYKFGIGVDHNAWTPLGGEKFKPVARWDEIPDGELYGAELEVDGQRTPLVLLKQGQQVHALGGICSHQGGPLAEGALVEGLCVECPWHQSRFDLRTGAVCQGPAAFAQPRYETRRRNGNLEVRLARD